MICNLKFDKIWDGGGFIIITMLMIYSVVNDCWPSSAGTCNSRMEFAQFIHPQTVTHCVNNATYYQLVGGKERETKLQGFKDVCRIGFICYFILTDNTDLLGPSFLFFLTEKKRWNSGEKNYICIFFFEKGKKEWFFYNIFMCHI